MYAFLRTRGDLGSWKEVCRNTGLFCGYTGALLRLYRALLRMRKALLRTCKVYMALLRMSKSLLWIVATWGAGNKFVGIEGCGADI